LKAIAEAAGGFYVPLGATGEGLQLIRKTLLGANDKHEQTFRQRRVAIERYQWPLAAAFALLLASMMVGPGRRARSRVSAAVSVALLASLIVGSAWPNGPLFAASPSDATAVAPADRTKPASEFNSGTAAYRAGRFPQAMQDFEQSIKRAPSTDPKRLRDQQDAYYNLGNTLYRAGQKTEQSTPQEAIRLWTDAVKAYDTALQLRSDDADSKFNRDLVQRRIDALRQQQKPPPPSQGRGQGQPPKPNGGAPPNPPPPGGNGGQEPRPPGAGSGDSARSPGQMSREEATQLLDAAKGEEHASQAPVATGAAARGEPPDKPFKNW